jgi:DNA-binding protein YbaB
LNAGFQPDLFTRKLRTYMRHRKNLTEMAATHIRMMQKAMEQMNIKLQNVIADITGKSGQAIIRAILNGEHNPEVLIELLDGRVKADRDMVRKSLSGIWKEEHLFELEQSFNIYHFYQRKIAECDQSIKKHLLSSIAASSDQIAPTKKSKSNKNNLSFDATQILRDITGTDLTEVFGITDTNAVEIISEIGFNMNKWPTSKHFTAWLNLAPNNRVSGGKMLSSRTQRRKNKAGQIFKMAAFAVQRSKNWLAIFYHRLKAKCGTARAITATARKIATIFYKLIKDKIPFNPISVEDYSLSFKERQMKKLQKQAQFLGLSLIPTPIVT